MPSVKRWNESSFGSAPGPLSGSSAMWMNVTPSSSSNVA
jgi:hypothetical protein